MGGRNLFLLALLFISCYFGDAVEYDPECLDENNNPVFKEFPQECHSLCCWSTCFCSGGNVTCAIMCASNEVGPGCELALEPTLDDCCPVICP